MKAIVIVFACMVAAVNCLTWEVLTACEDKITEKCNKEHPDTPEYLTTCYMNKTIEKAFKDTTDDYHKCLDDKVGAKGECVRLDKRVDPKTLPNTYMLCQMKSKETCDEKCKVLTEKKDIENFVKCLSESRKVPFSMFKECFAENVLSRIRE